MGVALLTGSGVIGLVFVSGVMGAVIGLLLLAVVVHFGVGIAIAVAPILAVVRIGKILENSTDYSIQNTVKQALFLPTSREAKYKANDVVFAPTVNLVGWIFCVGGRTTGSAHVSLWLRTTTSVKAEQEDQPTI